MYSGDNNISQKKSYNDSLTIGGGFNFVWLLRESWGEMIRFDYIFFV